MEHNNANMIALGGRVLGVDLAKEILSAYLNSTFQGGRHLRRIEKISEIEKTML
jgi:ribose 5-phosphate isomerase B